MDALLAANRICSIFLRKVRQIKFLLCIRINIKHNKVQLYGHNNIVVKRNLGNCRGRKSTWKLYGEKNNLDGQIQFLFFYVNAQHKYCIGNLTILLQYFHRNWNPRCTFQMQVYKLLCFAKTYSIFYFFIRIILRSQSKIKWLLFGTSLNVTTIGEGMGRIRKKIEWYEIYRAHQSLSLPLLSWF